MLVFAHFVEVIHKVFQLGSYPAYMYCTFKSFVLVLVYYDDYLSICDLVWDQHYIFVIIYHDYTCYIYVMHPKFVHCVPSFICSRAPGMNVLVHCIGSGTQCTVQQDYSLGKKVTPYGQIQTT